MAIGDKFLLSSSSGLTLIVETQSCNIGFNETSICNFSDNAFLEISWTNNCDSTGIKMFDRGLDVSFRTSSTI